MLVTMVTHPLVVLSFKNGGCLALYRHRDSARAAAALPTPRSWALASGMGGGAELVMQLRLS